MAGVRIQMTVSKVVADKMEKMCAKMGFSKSVLLSVMVEEKWKEEHMDEGEKG